MAPGLQDIDICGFTSILFIALQRTSISVYMIEVVPRTSRHKRLQFYQYLLYFLRKK